MLFILGCNTGFRISELLTLRNQDVLNKAGRVEDSITMASSKMKGGKYSRTVKLNQQTRKALANYINENNIKNWLFPSSRSPEKPIDRIQAWRSLGMGTHTMRKTFATSVYEYLLELVARGERVDPMRSASKALGHVSIANTERYLALDQDKINEAIENIGI